MTTTHTNFFWREMCMLLAWGPLRRHAVLVIPCPSSCSDHAAKLDEWKMYCIGLAEDLPDRRIYLALLPGNRMFPGSKFCCRSSVRALQGIVVHMRDEKCDEGSVVLSGAIGFSFGAELLAEAVRDLEPFQSLPIIACGIEEAAREWESDLTQSSYRTRYPEIAFDFHSLSLAPSDTQALQRHTGTVVRVPRNSREVPLRGESDYTMCLNAIKQHCN